MSVVSVWVGATSDSEALVVSKIEGSSARLKVSVNSDLSDPALFFGPVSPAAQGVVKITATGLQPDTVYHYAVEEDSVLDTVFPGQFRTHPVLNSQASFRIATASCAGLAPDFPGVGAVLSSTHMSNSPIFDTIRTLSPAPLMFLHSGDTQYYDLGNEGSSVAPGTLTNYRRSWDDILLQPNQHSLYRNVATVIDWDDHDYGPNNSDGSLPDKANAQTAYREKLPHYPLPDGNGAIYHSWQIGRILFIAADVRSNRSPNSDPDNSFKTMLGAAQKNWMQNLLTNSTAAAFVWLMPSQWHGTSTDSWDVFSTERDELVTMFDELGWIDRMCIISGDYHGLAMDSGLNTTGGIPVFQFASLDSTPGSGPGSRPYDMGSFAGRAQFGTLDFSDLGDRVEITAIGWQTTTPTVWQSFTFDVFPEGAPQTPPTPLTPVSPEFLDAVTGSHQMVVAAQVLKEWADTAEPIDGIPLNVHNGDVTFDASADIRATCTVVTDPGNFDVAGLLEPYGNEIFLQRGIVLGSGRVEMHPLGYYRITDVEQEDAPFGQVTISGQDRMSGIIEGRLLRPRQFVAGSTIAGVFSNLVHEIYPDAQIVFDDNTGSQTLQRSSVAERDRYEFLRDLAKARGKLMFWDRLGRLRINSPPDPSSPKWDISYGERGVLISLGRSRSRGGTYNAVVASGEAGDTSKPVQAIAIDNNPNSPTYWHGRYGKVPRFYVSPFITQKSHAESAARSILAAQLGLASNIRFNMVPNPSLDLGDAVRVAHDPRLGLATHVLDTLTIPLISTGAVSAATRAFSGQVIELT